jgi:hypothetical protein
MKRIFERIHLYATHLLVLFCLGVVLLNWGRWQQWDQQGFKLYLTQPIMVTTLYDFAFVLLIMLVLIRQDAIYHQVRYLWIVLFFPFMPTVGLLLYVSLRNRTLRKRGIAPPPLMVSVTRPALHGDAQLT